ncbi:MAG: hypothetical protein N3D19_03400, partial [Archaeoglobaceae archaeon]|nr:hypothetical protein [Archaeoglobaceae archaeon]
MKRYGLVGLVLLALVLSATPAMAQTMVPGPISLNATDPLNLTLKKFDVSPISGKFPLNVSITIYVDNKNATTNLTGNVTLFINGTPVVPTLAVPVTTTGMLRCSFATGDVNVTVNVSAGATDARCTLYFNFSDSAWVGVHRVSVGNYTHCLPYKLVGVLNDLANNTTLRIDRVKLSATTVSVGKELTISADWGYYSKDLGTRRIAVITYEDFVAVGEDVARILDKAKRIIALPEAGGSDSWTFAPDAPGYYYVLMTGNETFRVARERLLFRAEPPVPGVPTVSISVDRSVVVVGDYVNVKASMSSDVAVSPVMIFITAAGIFINETGVHPSPGFICYSTVPATTVVGACGGKDSWWIRIPRGALADQTEVLFVAKIDVGSGPTRAEAVATFKVVRPTITELKVPPTHVIGRDLVIEGTSNLAKSGTKADSGVDGLVENLAVLTIKDLAGEIIVRPTMAVAQSYIGDAGKFRFKIDNFGVDKPPLRKVLRPGFYTVEVEIRSGELTDKESAT